MAVNRAEEVAIRLGRAGYTLRTVGCARQSRLMRGPVGGSARARIEPKSLDDYKVVPYKNQPEGWVAEVLWTPACHVLMSTQEAAVAEVAAVFQMIADEYAQRGQPLPADTTEIAHAWRASDEFRRVARKLGFQ